MTRTAGDIGKYASSIGLLVDRCVKREEAFGSVWLVGDDKAATCAHHVVLYEDFLTGLKVSFPSINQEWEVVDAVFHPRFDRKVAHEMAQRSLSTPVPALALQDHNLVILTLSRHLSGLSRDTATTFNKKLALAPLPRMKGLGGEVDELGLALVIQTMTNARKDGSIVISDERNRPAAKLFCRDGRVIYAKFGKLSGEGAVFQMFSQQVTGQFTLQTQNKPEWSVTSMINRPTDSLLIEAHRRMDEIPRMLNELGGHGAAYIRVADILSPQVLAEEVRADAELVWRFLDGGVAIDQLWEDVHIDDYAIYKALLELQRTKQIVEVPYAGHDALNPMQPLDMAPHLLLSPWDEVVSLTVHPTVGRPQIRHGSLVGLLRPNDPWHLLHNLNLPYRAAGSPLFKNGQVIGMHCGMLPLDPQLHALPSHLHQMLWVESIQQCLDTEGKVIAERPSKKSVGLKRPVLPGELDGARIQCPKCNASMLKIARFCGTCGQRLG